MTNIKSKCCNAEVKAVCSDDFGDKEDRGGQTCHYECLKCGEACDIQTENTNIIEELNKEFFERFGANKIWVNPSVDNVETILDIWSFIQKALSQRDEEWREKITKWAIGRLPAFPPKAIIKDFEELKLISVKDIEEFLTQSHLLNKEPISISERLVWEDIKKLNENAEELKKLKSQVK